MIAAVRRHGSRHRRIKSVHPRVCGEHTRSPPASRSPSGSSPRMRGTRPDDCKSFKPLRFIPAYAGNTRPRTPRRSTSTAHPRVCGEHMRARSRPLPGAGSSPRMRGTPRALNTNDNGSRFIPAYAGNTYRWNTKRSTSTVHPRVCGEHAASHRRETGMIGSSPRMRGTPRLGGGRAGGVRFIPAYAGNTKQPLTNVTHPPVHPRVCGEHVAILICAVSVDGSSPRMRGTLLSRPNPVHGFRFIPAYAGNTSRSPSPTARRAVHPRVCGEHCLCRSRSTELRGSSPRMRGTRCLGQYMLPYFRFIPAYAGNT